jgi:electron transfer flavoprotein beta subunit
MKILVPFKVVPDQYAARTAAGVGGDNQWVVNPLDEIAVEEAARIKERGTATEVIGVTIGAPPVDDPARAVLAMGADRVIRVNDTQAQPFDPYRVSRVLKAIVDQEAPQLVIMGKQAIDDDANQVGQMLAGLLDWPQATFVSKVEFADDLSSLACTRETDDGLETISIRLPGVVTTDLRLNEPRFVSLAGLIKARRKPIEVLACDQLKVNAQPATTVLRTTARPQRRSATKVDSVNELITQLREEAKVL